MANPLFYHGFKVLVLIKSFFYRINYVKGVARLYLEWDKANKDNNGLENVVKLRKASGNSMDNK